MGQMAASPLLSSEPQAAVGEDGDDGWGSPEPARNQQQAAPQQQEEDGWGGWEQEDAGEGWGSWEEEGGRRGSAPAFPEGPKPQEGESMGGEREADLEDGWGDDSWGGHSTGGEASSLAANLRLGQEEDGLAGRESRDRSASTELGTAEEARAQALELQGKIAEKEGVIETLETELSSIRGRFNLLEDELTEAQDARDEAERKLKSAEKGKTMLEAQAEGEREKLADLSKEVEKAEELRAVVEETNTENLKLSSRLEEEKKLHCQATQKLLELDAMAEELGELQGAKEREERAREEVSKLVEQLKDQEVRGREDGEKWGVRVNSLEAELRSLSEQLEESGKDMSEKISQVTHLEQKLAEALAGEEEAKAHREEIRAREEDGMLKHTGKRSEQG